MVELPRSSPSDQRVGASAVTAFLDAIESRTDIELHSLMVVRHGHVVAEGWWAPYSPERVHLLYSVSKSFTSAAVGLARAEGLLDLDDTVLLHFPELDGVVTDPRARSLRLRHLAAMASGHTRDTMDEVFAADPEEPVRGFLQVPPDEEPGSVFAYNQPCTYTLAAVVQRRSGRSLTDYLRPRLLDPLGIGEVGWQSWPEGREVGFTGLHARTEDVAKLGLLHLQRGRWGEDQLLSEEWVDLATAKHVDNPDEPNLDWRQGYGYQFWRQRHGYRGDGAFGQFCIVLPEQDAVVATTGSTLQMQAVLDAVWEHLLPGLGADEGDPAADEVLAERLTRLEIPPLSGSAVAPHGHEAQELDVTVSDGTHHLRRVGWRTTPDGLELTLTEENGEVTVPVGDGSWRVSAPRDCTGQELPLAASGGWVDGALRVDVLFLESAHRFLVRAGAGGAAVTWNHPPLGFRRLQDMHCPR